MKRISLILTACALIATDYALSQNVGIGTATPSEKLHVQGGARITSLSGINNRLVQSNPTGVLSNIADGTNGQILTTDGSGNLTWTDNITSIIAGPGLTGGGTNGVITLNAWADNGLYVNIAADRIRLGGVLEENTTIYLLGWGMNFDLNGPGDFSVQDNALEVFQIRDDGVHLIGDDVYWRDVSTGGANLMSLTDDGVDGRLQIYEGGATQIDLDANTGSIFNELGLDRDFRVETDNNQNTLFVDGGQDVVGIRKVPSAPWLLGAGVPVNETYYPLEIGSDGGGGQQLLLAYYNGGDPMIHPEELMGAWGWGYSGTAVRPWWYTYTDNLTIVSQRKTKRDIVSVSQDEALEAYVMNDIVNLNADFYKKKGDLDEVIPGLEARYRPHMQLGYMLDEVPDYACGSAFAGVNPYALTTMSLIGVKYNYKEINKLKEAVGSGVKINDFGSEDLSSKVMWVSFDEAFSNKLSGKPVVTITSNNANVTLSIIEKTDQGFKVEASEVVSGLEFDWIAMGKTKAIQMKQVASEIDPTLREKLEISDEERAAILNRHKTIKPTLEANTEATRMLKEIGNK